MKSKCILLAIVFLVFTHLSSENIDIQFNSHNWVSSVTYSNGYSILYSYDSIGNITNQVISQPNVTPLSPSQFNIINDGDLVTLSWEPVVSNVNGTPIIVPLYVIEASSDPFTGFTLIGTTNQTQFSVSSSSYQQRFYRIRAAINYQRDDVHPAVHADTITTETRSNE